jgi:hypothetical protein
MRGGGAKNQLIASDSNLPFLPSINLKHIILSVIMFVKTHSEVTLSFIIQIMMMMMMMMIFLFLFVIFEV